MELEARLESEEIENLKGELEDATTKSKRELDNLHEQLDNLYEELDANRVEIAQYKREFGAKTSLFSQLEKDKLLSKELENLKITHLKTERKRDSVITKLECDVKLKAGEIECLKSVISQLEREVKSKSAEIENLKSAPLKAEAVSKSQLSQLEGEVKSKSAEIENLKVEIDESTAVFKDVLALKNAKIRQLEVELAKILPLESTNELVAQNLKISRDVQSGFAKVETSLRSLISRPSEDVRSGLEKVQKSLIGVLNRTNEMTIRWRFTDISKLAAAGVYSLPTEFVGISWLLYVAKRGEYLSFHLEAQNKDAVKWSCSAIFKMQLISQNNFSINHSMDTQKKAYVYDDKSANWGFVQFISFKDLLDEKKGYVMNDTIIVAAVIKAFPAN